MDVQLYVGEQEVELTDNSFQISISGMNPITGAEQVRKYTSSFKVPSTMRNDAIFGGWKNPQLKSRTAIAVDIVAGGVRLDSFKSNVSYGNNVYSLSLSQASILKDANIARKKSNRVQGQLGERLKFGSRDNYINRSATGVSDLIYGLASEAGYSIETRESFFNVVEAKCDVSYVPEIISEAQDSAAGQSDDFAFKPGADSILMHSDKFADMVLFPDMIRYISLKPAIDYVLIDIRDYDYKEGDEVYIQIYQEIINLVLSDVIDYDMFFSSPATTIMIDPINEDRADIAVYARRDGKSVSIPFYSKGIVPQSISGDEWFLNNYDDGMKDLYSILREFCKLNSYTFKIDESNKKIYINRDYDIDNVRDLTDNIVSINSISEYASGAQRLNVAIGDVAAMVEYDIAAYKDISDGMKIAVPNKVSGLPTIGEMSINKRDFRPTLNTPNLVGKHFANQFNAFTSLIIDATVEIGIIELLQLNTTCAYAIGQLNVSGYITEVSGYSIKTGLCRVKLLIIK